MPTLEARGVEIAWSERGEGSPVLLIHETAATSAVWDPLAEALAVEFRAIAYDRRGWGASSEPDDYRRTTIEEQSEDAAALIEAVADGPATVCGAGLGAVIGLDLLLRRSEVVSAAVLIEPALFQLTPLATEALSEDRHRIEIAAGARENVIDVFLAGGLPALGAGVERLPDETAAAARDRPRERHGGNGNPSRLADAAASVDERGPSFSNRHRRVDPDAAPRGLSVARRPAGAELRTRGESPQLPPHLGAAAEIAAIVAEVSS